jgi:soluble lytic murein transglycosylase
MRRGVGWVVCLIGVAACAAAPGRSTAPAHPVRASPDRSLTPLEDAAAREPALADYALWFRARAAAGARPADALALARELVTTHPDSIWVGRARLLEGDLLRRKGDLGAARSAFDAAGTALPSGSPWWLRATLGRAETAAALGDADGALEVAHDIRRVAPRGIAARRARRLTERLRRARPDLVVDHVDEAELRLRAGDARGARDETEVALGSELAPAFEARALWVRAQAEHALALPAAESTCLALADRVPSDPLAARALVAAAGWRWNADDDPGALRLFRDVVRRFPDRPQAAEALYGMGRIAQEEGRYDEARKSYARIADEFPEAEVAAEARWRAAWMRYLAGDMAAAEHDYARVAAESRDAPRVAAEYWRARALERLGREDEARQGFAHLVDLNPTSYYAGLAEERLGRPAPASNPVAPPPPPFPAELAGPHAERARVLSTLGFGRSARRELDALADADAPRPALVDAYRAIGAISPAVRLAAAEPRSFSAPPTETLYPLGYWDVVEPAARAEGVDPLLVVSLIRQESLFDPDAVSSAGARGLMQLLPSTARRVHAADGGAAPTSAALHDVATNVRLGVTLLSRLLTRYGGSTVKALAAYNGGEDAVAKWERRYAGREPDEFVELISYRETRDYVKAVLRNLRAYRQLYAAPSASTSSVGSPPNAPFDMTMTTSPDRALATR